MAKVTTEHPLWPEFVKRFKGRFGVEPNLSIREDQARWEWFRAGNEAGPPVRDMGLVITQEGEINDRPANEV